MWWYALSRPWGIVLSSLINAPHVLFDLLLRHYEFPEVVLLGVELVRAVRTGLEVLVLPGPLEFGVGPRDRLLVW